MNKFFGIVLAAAMVCGSSGAAFAATTDQNCDTQLHAQLHALQQQIATLQSNANPDIQSSSGTFQVQTGG